jgi:hypothetical protein
MADDKRDDAFTGSALRTETIRVKLGDIGDTFEDISSKLSKRLNLLGEIKDAVDNAAASAAASASNTSSTGDAAKVAGGTLMGLFARKAARGLVRAAPLAALAYGAHRLRESVGKPAEEEVLSRYPKLDALPNLTDQQRENIHGAFGGRYILPQRTNVLRIAARCGELCSRLHRCRQRTFAARSRRSPAASMCRWRRSSMFVLMGA